MKVEERKGEYNGKNWEKIILHVVFEDKTVNQVHTKKEDLKVYGIEDLNSLVGAKKEILTARLYRNSYDSLIGLR